MTRLYRCQHDLPQNRRIVLAIGNFDGVHLGHQALIHEMHKLASAHQAESWIMTFEPHAAEYYQTKSSARLSSLREKMLAFSALQVDAVYCLHFNHALSVCSPHDFLEMISKKLDIQHIIVGTDFRFGHNRAGDVETLKKSGFSVTAFPPFLLDGKRVSSSLVRNALLEGDFKRAEHFLGKPYTITGRVQHGDHLGKQLGFPTANLKWSKPSSPLHGIYIASVTGIRDNDSNWYPAAASLGVRPSVQGNDFRCEIHLLDQDIDLYGKHLRVQFHKKLHDERQYDTLLQLQQAIAHDVHETQLYFREQGLHP